MFVLENICKFFYFKPATRLKRCLPLCCVTFSFNNTLLMIRNKEDQLLKFSPDVPTFLETKQQGGNPFGNIRNSLHAIWTVNSSIALW